MRAIRLEETLTTDQKINILQGGSNELFDVMILPEDSFYKHKAELCLGYYFSRSASKRVSPTVTKITELVDNPETVLGRMVRSKYVNKWARIYEALVTTDYSALTDEEYSKISMYDSLKEVEYGKTDTASGIDTKTNTPGIITTTKTKIATDEKTDTVSGADSNVYGFNSSEAVPTATDTAKTSENYYTDPEKNYTEGTTSYEGEDAETVNYGETHTLSGKDTHGENGSSNENTSGRNSSGASLIQEELDMRNKQTFFDIVYRDIDSIMTKPMYI